MIPNIVYNYNSNVVRTQVTDDGEPLFCLADVCKVLELSNPSAVATQIKEEFSCPKLNLGQVSDPSGAKSVTFINEPQLYFVLMRSRSDNAKPFRQWVVNNVLPSIRKTGAYSIKQNAINTAELLNVSKIVLDAAGITGNQLALALDRVVQSKTGESPLALSGVELVRPQQKRLATPTELGKPIGLSAVKVNKVLEERGLQTKVAGQWVPTSKGLEAGATVLDTGKKHGSGTPVTQLKWPLDVLD